MPIPSIPSICSPDLARWDTEVQANYVAEQLTAEFGTQWDVTECGLHGRYGHHFHVIERYIPGIVTNLGVQFAPPERP